MNDKSQGSASEALLSSTRDGRRDEGITEARVVNDGLDYGATGAYSISQTNSDHSQAEALIPVAQHLEPLIGGPLGFIAGRRRIVIQQKHQLMEAVLQGLGCACCEQPNEYSLFDHETGELLSVVKEESGLCGRVCCHPFHSLTLHYEDRRYGAPPGSIAMRTEKPFSCNCCACCNICQHEATARLPNGEPVSVAKVPRFGGGLTPTIEVMDRNGQIESTITGPTCCLGGLIETCCNIEFDYHQHGKAGPVVGKIVKLKPMSITGKLKEALSASGDVFVLELPADATPEQTASMVSSALFMDYLWFENSAPLSYDSEQGCKVNVCNAYCCGLVLPCGCACGGEKNQHDN